MAANSNGKPKDDDLFKLLHEFEGMMRQMIKAGVTYHSFREHATRLYVNAAVGLSDGNYAEAARKLSLHRNNVFRIMGANKVRDYAKAFNKNGNGGTEGE